MTATETREELLSVRPNQKLETRPRYEYGTTTRIVPGVGRTSTTVSAVGLDRNISIMPAAREKKRKQNHHTARERRLRDETSRAGDSSESLVPAPQRRGSGISFSHLRRTARWSRCAWRGASRAPVQAQGVERERERERRAREKSPEGARVASRWQNHEIRDDAGPL